MTDRNADMRHILTQVRTMTGGTVMESDSPATRMIAELQGMNLPARITFHPLSDTTVEATDLESPQPGNGQGRATMAALLDAADRHGVTLEVEPVWDEDVDGALHPDDLELWYLRLGFKFIPNRDPDADREQDRFMIRKPKHKVTESAIPIMEDEQSDHRTREAAESAFQAVRDYLTRHADYLPDVLQSVRDGDFAIRGSKVGLARDLVIVFTHTGHSGIGTAGSNDVILINCLRKPGDTKYLETRFGTGGHDSFVHEYAHYLSQGREYNNSAEDYEKHGETAYYNNPEEINAVYVESTAGFHRLIRSIIEYASPEQLAKYTGMSDQQLYEFLRSSCVKKDFLKHLDTGSRRRFDKRCVRFVSQTIRPMLNAGKVSESLTEQRVTTWGGATINVLRNPTKKAFENAISGDVQVLRGLLSGDGRDLYLWDAYMAVHPNIIQELGLGDYDCIMYVRGRWDGPVRSLEGGYKPAIERITPTPPPTAAQRARDDKLLQDLFDDPDFAKLMGESQVYALPKG